MNSDINNLEDLARVAEGATLKLCPFCGAAPHAHPQNVRDGQIWKAVWCDTCAALGPEKTGEAEAVIAWNTRASDEEIRELRGALERAAQALERASVCQDHPPHARELLDERDAVRQALGGGK